MKARFKTIILSALGAISAFAAVTYTSCTPDKCKAIVCAYGGTCKEGACICLSGYEGVQCETITKNKFKGTWHVWEKGTTTSPAEYSITVNEGASLTELTIDNFYNKLTNPVSVGIKGDTMFIPQQTIEGHIIQGKGYIQESKYYGKNAQMIVEYSVKTPEGKVNDFGLTIGNASDWSR